MVEDEAILAPAREVMQADAQVLQHTLVEGDGRGLVRRDEVAFEALVRFAPQALTSERLQALQQELIAL